jgi:hypothetical protein
LVGQIPEDDHEVQSYEWKSFREAEQGKTLQKGKLHVSKNRAFPYIPSMLGQ